MQLGFGAGSLWGTPLLDSTGAAIANPTPVKFGVLQEITLDIEFSQKALYGGNQFPVAIGRGQGKVTGAAKNAQINGLLWGSLLFGQAVQAGIQAVLQDTTGAAIPASPFTITPTPPSSGVWLADLGVINASGNPMTRVASAPTTGQYSVAAGVYTFAAADTGLTVFINYRYTATSTTANKQTVLSQPMGYSPSFAVDLLMVYQGQNLAVHLYNATSAKLALQTKVEDFLIPQFDFECFADTQNRVLDWGTTQ
jgi:hypothetical protein